MKRKSDNDAALERLFSAGKASPPEPSADFMARLVAEAEAAAGRAVADRSAVKPAGGSPLRRIRDLIFPATGLVAATAAGIWIGFTAPENAITEALLSDDDSVALTAFLPGTDMELLFAWEENG